MVDKNKLVELESAATEKKAELERVRLEKSKAGTDAVRRVAAEKRERIVIGQIAALESAKAAAEYTPPEPTDRAELLKGYQKYFDEKAAKVQKAQDALTEAQRERREIEAGLQQAAEDCDAARTIEFSEKRAVNDSKQQYLMEMLERAKALPVFPEGALMQEWESICEMAMPDWKQAVLRVETLAAAYKAACVDLLQMHDTLLSVRAEVAAIADRAGVPAPLLHPVFTVGLDADRLIVRKGDYIRLAGIVSPITGTAL